MLFIEMTKIKVEINGFLRGLVSGHSITESEFNLISASIFMMQTTGDLLPQLGIIGVNI